MIGHRNAGEPTPPHGNFKTEDTMKNSLTLDEVVHGTNGEAPQPTKPKMVELFSDHWYKINFLTPVEYFPSVTTKLGIVDKPFLAKWRGDIGNREADYRLKEGQEKGSAIHNAWFVVSQGGAAVYQNPKHPELTQPELDKIHDEHGGNVVYLRDQDEQVDIFKLQEWDRILQPDYLHHEITVYSLKNKEAGTCDKVIQLKKDGQYLINGAKPITLKAGAYVVDLKTGNFADDNGFMQIAAYREMLIEMELFGREDLIGGIILHTGSKVRTGIRGLATLVRTSAELDNDYLDFRHAAALWDRKHKDDRPEIFEFPNIITFNRQTTANQTNKE